MEKNILNRKDFVLKKGKPQKVELHKFVNTLNTYVQFEHNYNGKQKHLALKYQGADGRTGNAQFVLLEPILKRPLASGELIEEYVTYINEVTLETQELELHVTLSVFEDVGTRVDL